MKSLSTQSALDGDHHCLIEASIGSPKSELSFFSVIRLSCIPCVLAYNCQKKPIPISSLDLEGICLKTDRGSGS